MAPFQVIITSEEIPVWVQSGMIDSHFAFAAACFSGCTLKLGQRFTDPLGPFTKVELI